LDGVGDAAADGNSVFIRGSVIDARVEGAFAMTEEGNATANGNSLVIEDSTLKGNNFGGYASSEKGNATANGNRILIKNSNVSGLSGLVYGGVAFSDDGKGTANDNVVEVIDSQIQLYIFGGYAEDEDGNNGISATGNTVILEGSSSVMGVAGGFDNELYGNPSPNIHPSSDSFSGNELIIRNPAAGGVSISGVAAAALPSFGRKLSAGSFERYNFILGTDSDGRSDPMLSAGGYVVFGDSLTGGDKSSSLSLNFLGGGRVQQTGEEYFLIDANVAGAGLIGGLSDGNDKIYGRKGATLRYGYELYDENNNPYASDVSKELHARITSVGVNPRAKALSEGRLAGADFVSQAADASIAAISGARARMGNSSPKAGVYPFGSFGYAKSRLNSGSHVDSEGASMVMGLAATRPSGQGEFTLGGFVEAGTGNYDSYNAFSDFSDVNGSGDTSYYGAGLSGMLKSRGDGRGYFYGDASLRFGRSETDFHSHDLSDALGTDVRYETDESYYGAHFGIGYVRTLTEQSSLDFYSRFMWTHVEGDSLILPTGDPLSFDDVESLRWRTGFRYRRPAGKNTSFYVGAAYEHEFDGTANATTYGMSIDAPSIKGGTGIGELGLTYKDGGDNALVIDLGLSAFTGKREGIGVRLELSKLF
jgi:hypothetical protein